MSTEVVLLTATALLAVVAMTAAIVAVRAVRQLRAESARGDAVARVEPVAPREQPPSRDIQPQPPEVEVVRVVEGRVIVQPTQAQLVAATMTRPSVRLGILLTGVAHALRPESRDRIAALMRREYRGRRRARQQAARSAARATNGPPPDPNQGWVAS